MNSTSTKSSPDEMSKQNAPGAAKYTDTAEKSEAIGLAIEQRITGTLVIEGENGTQGGSLELGPNLKDQITGATMETPYIDFHFFTGSAEDYNTRIINTADDRLDLVTKSGSAVLSVNAQNVGIGTTAPVRKLQIGDDVAGLSFELGTASPDAGVFRFGNNSGWNLHFGRSREQFGGPLNFGPTGILMTIQDTGNVGIGKPPDQMFKLDVNGIINATDIYKNGTPLSVSQWTDVLGGINYGGGNVGIGTTAPTEALHVATGRILQGLDATDIKGSGIVAFDGLTAVIGASNTSVGSLNVVKDKFVVLTSGQTGSAPFLPLAFVVGGERMRITPDGNIGIGTTTPREALHVKGRVLQGLDATDIVGSGIIASGALVAVNSASNTSVGSLGVVAGQFVSITSGRTGSSIPFLPLTFWTGATERLRITPNGNVGIGTANAGARLEVVANSTTWDGWNEAIRLGPSAHSAITHPGSGILLGFWQKRFYVADMQARKYMMTIDGNAGGDAELEGRIKIKGNRTYLLGHDGTFHWIMAGGTVEGQHNALGFDVKNKQIVHRWRNNFMIDHPLDPEKKFLLHSALEGPETAVFYRGEGQLSKGKATIELPDYFESLTRKKNRTVLITPKLSGNAPVSVLAASEVKDGEFTVRMIDENNPSQKFYWEVIAERADLKPLEVERAKK